MKCGLASSGMDRAPLKSSALIGTHRHKSMSTSKLTLSQVKCIVVAIPDQHSVSLPVVTRFQPGGKRESNIFMNISINLERREKSRTSIVPERTRHSDGSKPTTAGSFTNILTESFLTTVWKNSVLAKYSMTMRKSNSSGASIFVFSATFPAWTSWHLSKHL